MQVSKYVPNQVTIEGLSKSEINGAIDYTKDCLKQSDKMEAWERKEYKATLRHFNKLLTRLTYNYNNLIEEGVDVTY